MQKGVDKMRTTSKWNDAILWSFICLSFPLPSPVSWIHSIPLSPEQQHHHSLSLSWVSGVANRMGQNLNYNFITAVINICRILKRISFYNPPIIAYRRKQKEELQPTWYDDDEGGTKQVRPMRWKLGGIHLTTVPVASLLLRWWWQ